MRLTKSNGELNLVVVCYLQRWIRSKKCTLRCQTDAFSTLVLINADRYLAHEFNYL